MGATHIQTICKYENVNKSIQVFFLHVSVNNNTMSSSFGMIHKKQDGLQARTLPITALKTVPMGKETVHATKESDECEKNYTFFMKAGSVLLELVLAWGLVTAFFSPMGWAPNSAYMSMIAPGLSMMMPFVFAYTAGEIIHPTRGGVLASFLVLGASVTTNYPLIFNALYITPIYVFMYSFLYYNVWKRYILDRDMPNKYISLAVSVLDSVVFVAIAFGFTIVAYEGTGPASKWFADGLGTIAKGLANTWPPLSHIAIEPAKLLFLNNAVNDVLVKRGEEDIAATGNTIWFMLETNPGPGAGVLLAFLWNAGMFRPDLSCGKLIRRTVPLAFVIHLFGGVQEVYFLYVLMRPRLLIALIVGGFVGSCIFVWGDAGYTAPPSPGSLIAIANVTVSGKTTPVVFGILLATVASFGTSLLLFRIRVLLCFEYAYGKCLKLVQRNQ